MTLGVVLQSNRYGVDPFSKLIGLALAGSALALLYFAFNHLQRQYLLVYGSAPSIAIVVAKKPIPTDRPGHATVTWRYRTSVGQTFDMTTTVDEPTYISIDIGYQKSLHYVVAAPTTVIFEEAPSPWYAAVRNFFFALLLGLGARPIVFEALGGRWDPIDFGARFAWWYVPTRVLAGTGLLFLAATWLAGIERPKRVTWDKAEGRVVGSWKEQIGRCKGRGCWLVYEFRDHQGRLIRARHEGGDGFFTFRTDQPLTVFFDRDNPARSLPGLPPAIESGSVLVRLSGAIGSLGAGIFIIRRAYWVTVLALARRRHRPIVLRHLKIAFQWSRKSKRRSTLRNTTAVTGGGKSPGAPRD